MLYYKNLNNIVFSKNQQVECDELVVLSGYVGPIPVQELKTLPIRSTVIYGMYGAEGIGQSLHKALLAENKNKVSIFYSTIPVHAKCYIWKNKGKIVSALIGSANFSVNGLNTPHRELLADATVDTFSPLNEYVEFVLEQAINCKDGVVSKKKKSEEQEPSGSKDLNICTLPLYVKKENKDVVPQKSGLNWGMASLSGSHCAIDDAYIAIKKDHIRNYPHLFQVKTLSPEDSPTKKGHRHNDCVEIIWDDGTTMKGLLEGNQSIEIDGIKETYPKQFSTTPKKSELGEYIRKRLGVPSGQFIRYEDLKKYGRTCIDISLLGEGVYYFDFSPQNG